MFFRMFIDTVVNAGFSWTLRRLWLPYAVLIFGFVNYYHDALVAMRAKSQKKRPHPWLFAALIYLVCLAMAYPYVLGVNTLGGPHPKVVYHGVITKKWSSAGRSTSYYLTIKDDVSNSNLSFHITKDYYNSCQVGQPFERTMNIGLFGIPYRWKF